MTKHKDPVEKFSNWYHTEYLLSRNNYAPILYNRNRTAQARFNRIGEVAKLLIVNPNDIQTVRKMVSKKFSITMRTALDSINEANNILEEYYEKTKV